MENTLRDVLSHIRPQGHPSWKLNTCLVSNAQLTKWWAALGVTPAVADSYRVGALESTIRRGQAAATCRCTCQ